MGRSPLGRVLDPGALDACAGGRARLRVDVPEAWLIEGGEILLTVPRRISCARCEGGGCDGCARSGALRTPEGAPVLRAHLPRSSPQNVALRISQPFGPDHAIAQLLLELSAAASPSACVTRIEPPAAPARGRPWPLLIAGVALLGAVLAALLGR